MHSYRHYDEEQRQEAKLCFDHGSVNQPNDQPEWRVAKRVKMRTGRATPRPLQAACSAVGASPEPPPRAVPTTRCSAEASAGESPLAASAKLLRNSNNRLIWTLNVVNVRAAAASVVLRYPRQAGPPPLQPHLTCRNRFRIVSGSADCSALHLQLTIAERRCSVARRQQRAGLAPDAIGASTEAAGLVIRGFIVVIEISQKATSSKDQTMHCMRI
jgi:hypothetical protein